jgi:hypothetical protein
MPMTRERATQLVHDTVARYNRVGTKLTIIYVHPLYLEFVQPVADQYGLHVFSDREAPLDRFLMR